jgi:hypothetical protein
VKTTAITGVFVIAAALTSSNAQGLTGGTPCPTLSPGQFQELGMPFVSGYFSGHFSLQTHPPKGRKGRDTCVQHDNKNADCTIVEPGVMHVRTDGGDAYFSLPAGTTAKVVLKDGQLNCSVK